MKNLGKYQIMLTVLILIFSNIYAQDAAGNECQPDVMTTVYDKYADKSVAQSQVSIWYDYGREYHKKGTYGEDKDNYKKAIPFYWKAVVNDKSKQFKIIYGKLIDCYLNLNQPDSAMIVAYRGLEKYPDYATLHYHAGNLQQNLNNLSCAAPHYETLIKLETSQDRLKNYYETLANIYFQIEDQRCIAAQEEVVRLDPDNSAASGLLARMMEFFGLDPIKARLAAFENDSTNVNNARQLGLTAFESGKYKLAIRAFKVVLSSDENNIEALSYLGKSYESLDNLRLAIESYKKIIEIDDSKLNSICSLASVYSRLGQFSTAMNYTHKALAKDQNYGLAYMVQGEIYENAVNSCSNARKDTDAYSYDDKLVFEKARAAYLNAAKRDRNVASSAKSRYEQLKPFIRTKADIHMNAKRTKITDSCYQWISPSS